MTGQRFAYIICALLIVFIFSASDSFAISWNSDLKGALTEAKKSEKPIMIDFYTKWCHWCKELDNNTYRDAKVNSLADNFVCVKVDAEQDPQAASRYNVRGYPTVIFLNPDGSLNNTIIGYKDPAAFAGVMKLASRDIKSAPGKEAPNKLKLSGIIINKDKVPVAIINDIFVKEGDAIGEGRVSKIAKDKVDVVLKDKTITLTID